MLKNKIFYLLLLSSGLYAADVAQISALSNNASELKSALDNSAKAMRWVLAIIPVLLVGWAVSGSIKGWQEQGESPQGNQNSQGNVQKVFEMTLKVFFSIASVFIAYGLFARVYADPNGTHTFFYTWGRLVVDFWKAIF